MGQKQGYGNQCGVFVEGGLYGMAVWPYFGSAFLLINDALSTH